MNSIVILTPRYPTCVDPTALTFVQQLAWALADCGKKVTVICPLPVNLNRKFFRVEKCATEETHKGNQVTVYFPKVLGFGQKSIGRLNTVSLTTASFHSAVRNIINHMQSKPDVIYGHFMAPSGVTACRIGREYGIPAFIGYGESTMWAIGHFGVEKIKKEIESVAGVISVSTANKDELVENGIVPAEKIGIFPNGYLPSRFMPKDKAECRRELGLPEDAFIVSFVGHFIKRKGLDKLCEAIRNLDGVNLICAGKGEIVPDVPGLLSAGPVHPEKLASFYGASDIFVLPTQNEGCCNAIIEAMACGLPIVSSNLEFNDDILDDTNSVRIDPRNVASIAEAIGLLKNNTDLRTELASGSIEKSKELTLEKRARRIIEFMENKAEMNKG